MLPLTLSLASQFLASKLLCLNWNQFAVGNFIHRVQIWRAPFNDRDHEQQLLASQLCWLLVRFKLAQSLWLHLSRSSAVKQTNTQPLFAPANIIIFFFTPPSCLGACSPLSDTASFALALIAPACPLNCEQPLKACKIAFAQLPSGRVNFVLLVK